MKRVILAGAASLILMMTACSKHDDPIAPPQSSITVPDGGLSVEQGDSIAIKANATGIGTLSYSWTVNGQVVSSDTVLVFVGKEVGETSISLVTKNAGGESTASQATVTVYGKYKHGTFILNEGNMTLENGSLIFIDTKGNIYDSVYQKVNATTLGNVCQDMFIYDGKMYILSQNGGADGKLVIANAETLQKVKGFNDELKSLSSPSHIAVIDKNNVFIRDSRGISLFNPETSTLTSVKNSSSAIKGRMAVVNGKVFAASGKTILVLQPGKDTITAKIDMGATVAAITKSSDGALWVACTGSPAFIAKMNTSDYSITGKNTLTGFSFSNITAKGDTLYGNSSTNINRHIFSTGETKTMVTVKSVIENANIVYNPIAVHPVTGEVYMNTIKAYGWDFLINNISVFNFGVSATSPRVNYTDHTHFPAGIYFTDSFK